MISMAYFYERMMLRAEATIAYYITIFNSCNEH